MVTVVHWKFEKRDAQKAEVHLVPTGTCVFQSQNPSSGMLLMRASVASLQLILFTGFRGDRFILMMAVDCVLVEQQFSASGAGDDDAGTVLLWTGRGGGGLIGSAGGNEDEEVDEEGASSSLMMFSPIS